MTPAERLLMSLQRKVLLARQDPVHFVDLVLKVETTRQPIVCAPHQRVLLRFAKDHPRCVLLLPVAHSKTFSMAALGMWELGRDPTCRGAVISHTQGQAEKVLRMIRDYIRTSIELKAIFPDLQQSHRSGDPWTTTAITVERPPGIRDPSMVALGFEGAIPGSRLKFILIDDILTHENTATRESREKVYDWCDSSVFSRIDPTPDARIIVTNTAWHNQDVPHRLIEKGWPALRMEIGGLIELYNTDWDSDDLRPEHISSLLCRLSARTDTDALWPEMFSEDRIEQLIRDHLPIRFNQLYRNICTDEQSARCKPEWIELCKKNAREHGVHTFVSEYKGPNATFTGIDLAVSPGEAHDDTCFFTFEALPDGCRRILDIDIGQYDGPTIVSKLVAKHRAYNSIVRVESNAAQDYIRQFVLNQNLSIPIKAHMTGRAKAHPEHGVEGLFVEMSNGAWLIPNDQYGNVREKATRMFIDDCLQYAPERHTPDSLMACYMAREQAKAWGLGGKVIPGGRPNLSNLLSR